MVVNEWEEIMSLELKHCASLMEPPRVLVDGRNALDPQAARASGLLYRAFGRA